MRGTIRAVAICLLIAGCAEATPQFELREPSSPTAREVPPAVEAGATSTPASASVAIDVATSTPAPTLTPTLVPTPDEPIVERRPCRTESELAGFSPVRYTRPGPWPRPPASPTELSAVSTTDRYLSLTFDAEQDPTPRAGDP